MKCHEVEAASQHVFSGLVKGIETLKLSVRETLGVLLVLFPSDTDPNPSASAHGIILGAPPQVGGLNRRRFIPGEFDQGRQVKRQTHASSGLGLAVQNWARP
jgi:hypothetical protein